MTVPELYNILKDENFKFNNMVTTTARGINIIGFKNECLIYDFYSADMPTFSTPEDRNWNFVRNLEIQEYDIINNLL